MIEIITIILSAFVAVANPVMPDNGHYVYTAKASSLNDAVLRVVEIPHPPEKSFLSDEKTEEVVRGDFDIQMQPIAVSVENSGDIEPNQDPSKQEIAKMIKKAFPDEPLMVKIADCESVGLRHYVKGEVLRGEEVKEDIGLFQINETYWLEKSKKLGIDIYDLAGNIRMARHIYDTQGLSAWAASFKNCWRRM